ncbi:hypothetical protein [Streptomyces sp. MB09-02B]|uniref:hypothetical protein n=1 Tax=Streptomyces sp. MB09-02B TaxID=3028667 RepID=UPI0029BB4E90|nr:hypothetical protein [Streptomyces sp. MB09-02B]MDX3642591.1 hypothetical protein [Streptomyces sp. MB09-02B]
MGRDFPDGDRIKAFPFPVDRGLSVVAMWIGPMGDLCSGTWTYPWVGCTLVDFHVVMLFAGGPVRHMIDFVECELGAGELVWVRPRGRIVSHG